MTISPLLVFKKNKRH